MEVRIEISCHCPPVCNQDNKVIVIISFKGNPFLVIRVLRYFCQNTFYLQILLYPILDQDRTCQVLSLMEMEVISVGSEQKTAEHQ